MKYDILQEIVDELSEILSSSKEDQYCFKSTQQQLDIIYKEMHAAAILKHGTTLFAELNRLLDVSIFLYALLRIQIFPHAFFCLDFQRLLHHSGLCF
jgi:hypothetical protein